MKYAIEVLKEKLENTRDFLDDIKNRDVPNMVYSLNKIINELEKAISVLEAYEAKEVKE
jgi:hypothetical protein